MECETFLFCILLRAYFQRADPLFYHVTLNAFHDCVVIRIWSYSIALVNNFIIPRTTNFSLCRWVYVLHFFNIWIICLYLHIVYDCWWYWFSLLLLLLGVNEIFYNKRVSPWRTKHYRWWKSNAHYSPNNFSSQHSHQRDPRHFWSR